jgi:hypothetical protein
MTRAPGTKRAARFRVSQPSEHSEQVALAYMVRTHLDRLPELELFTAIPNAEQSKAQAGKKWAEGVRPGYPDTLLDLARGEWHGLRIELKRKAYWNVGADCPYAKGQPSPDQRAWHERLTRAGYLVFVTWGWEPAWDILRWYIPLPTYHEHWIIAHHTGRIEVPDFPRSRVYQMSGAERSGAVTVGPSNREDA